MIAGLGNPGGKYENTRHNVGFLTVDRIAARYNIKVTKLKHKALSGDGKIGESRVLLVKPQTFMNLSGESIRDIIEWYKLPVGRLIAVYDDVDIPLGKVRVRPGGSSGTHNGMRSLLYQLQSDAFPRVRIGIGKPPEGWELADFVLSRFDTAETSVINECIGKAADAVEEIVKSGINSAMNRYNG